MRRLVLERVVFVVPGTEPEAGWKALGRRAGSGRRANGAVRVDEGGQEKQETEAARLQLLPQANALARQISSKLLGREVS